MSEMVHITINKQPLEVPAGTRIIEAAKMLNIDIPHLCYHPDQTIKAHGCAWWRWWAPAS